MAVTEHYAIPLPDPAAEVDEEFYRLQQAWAVVDAAIWALANVVANKANASHGHGIADISGLVTALAGKMAATQTFALDDLTDVNGATGAATNYLLVKNASGQWVPSSAIAALGTHQHATADIVGLTAAINAAVAAVVAAAPTTLDTLNELAAAIGDDPNFAATIAAQIGLKAPTASPTFTGTPAGPTAAAGTNTTQLATTAFVAALGALKANLASPTFTGTPAAPTAAAGTNTTQLATTAFVDNALSKTVVKRSGQLTPSLGGTLTYAHGLSYTPDEYWAELECIATDNGWAASNVIRAHVDDNGGGYGIEVFRDGTSVYGIVGANGIGVHHNKTTGAAFVPTVASWRVRLCTR
ncbi:hypothetical protein PMI07_000885 [Rhizobium sp. CF080]|uniref:hypothetical protein n=1 Tax=Rhizobium sp. (strain CF080) TaxID=1144310 RepID=UPI0002718933|nr:hypothetical protein [Rhizobium sp. CF080]EUB97309.1 hypothetical protein PMI07_000885 [Rhizobium sp. CF080]